MSVVHTLLLYGVTIQMFTVFNNLIPCFFIFLFAIHLKKRRCVASKIRYRYYVGSANHFKLEILASNVCLKFGNVSFTHVILIST